MSWTGIKTIAALWFFFTVTVVLWPFVIVAEAVIQSWALFWDGFEETKRNMQTVLDVERKR